VDFGVSTVFIRCFHSKYTVLRLFSATSIFLIFRVWGTVRRPRVESHIAAIGDLLRRADNDRNNTGGMVRHRSSIHFAQSQSWASSSNA